MRDPDRLSDGADNLGASLLRSVKRYRVSEQTRQRVLAIAACAATASGVRPLPKTALSLGKVALWALPGALVLAGGYVLFSQKPSHAPAAVNVPPSSIRTAQPAQTAEAMPPPAPTPNPPLRDTSRVSTSPAPAMVSSSPSQSSTPHASSDLAGELAALDAAAKSIQAGNAAGALSQLDTYARAYPRGSLNLEAKVLRAEALDSAGRHEEAVALARSFVARNPTSPLAGRMRKLAEN